MYVCSCHVRDMYAYSKTFSSSTLAAISNLCNVMHFVYSFFMDVLRAVFSRKGTIRYNYTSM